MLMDDKIRVGDDRDSRKGLHKQLMFPRILNETVVKTDPIRFVSSKHRTHFPSIFGEKAHLRAPEADLKQKGAQAVWPKVRKLKEKRRNGSNFQTLEKTKQFGFVVPENKRDGVIETTREFKRKVLRFNVKLLKKDRDIQPGHSARQYLQYWRNHTNKKCRDSIVVPAEADDTGRCNVIKCQGYLDRNRIFSHLKIPPVPYQISKITKTVTFQSLDFLKGTEKRDPKKGQKHLNHKNRPNRNDSIGSFDTASKLTEKNPCRSKINYPKYWINSDSKTLKKCQNDLDTCRICSPSSESSGMSFDFLHRELSVLNPTSTMSSGNRYTRMKLAHILNS